MTSRVQSTVVKAPKALTLPTTNNTTNKDNDLTVEQFLEMKFQEMVKDVRSHADVLITNLRQEYVDGAAQINALVVKPSESLPMSLILKCIAGPHVGQKFRLESIPGEEDVFKMGRSTGKLFKEKGVSLYKDKEISTTHAKIEFKSGQAYLIDVKSTNGTLLNSEEIEDSVPYRLKEGDQISMGNTILLVHLSELNENNENEGNN